MTHQAFRDFVFELKEKTPLFIQQMEDKDVKGKYRFSLSGDIPSSTVHWGLGQTTFAARILYILDALNVDAKENITRYIQTFAHADGSFYDRYVARSTFMQRILRSIKYRNSEFFFNKPNERAETRQAKATLINLNVDSLDYRGFDLASLDIDQYFHQFDWCKPWAAASHINHLIFFTKYSKCLTDEEKEIIYKKIEDNVLPFLQEDGIYKINCKLTKNQKIGGLMKFLMGLSLIGLDRKYVKKSFIDFALDEMIACDACENFNTLYVLYYCSKFLDYRKDDIEKFALKEVGNWLSYYHQENGAFSFYRGRAQTTYYDAKMSKGLNEPDLHGTAMFIWGILVVSEILDLKDELKLKSIVL